MSTTRTGVPLLAGAKISLGSLNITNKNFEDYKPIEIAYIVGRYMKQHAEGGVYHGSVATIMYKLWPEYWEGKDVANNRIMKRIYSWLNRLGFRSKKTSSYESVWYLPSDLDDAYRAKIEDLHEPAPEPVTLKCLFCGQGPFESQAAFKSHKMMHQEEKATSMERVEEEVALEEILEELKETEKSGNTCPTCGAKISSRGMAPHLFAAHRQRHCSRCFKVVKIRGMGAHVRSHKTSKKARALLKEIRLHENQSRKYYADKLGWTLGSVSTHAKSLRQKGYIKIEGRTVATRYGLTARGRKNGFGKVVPIEAKAVPTEAPKEATPIKESQAPTVESVPGLPGGTPATVFQTVDGMMILVVDGKTYFVTQVSELVNKNI